MSKVTLKDAMSRITSELKNDKEFRRSWSANIAMAYIDNEHCLYRSAFSCLFSFCTRHTIANNAAEYFLKSLCDELKCPAGR